MDKKIKHRLSGIRKKLNVVAPMIWRMRTRLYDLEDRLDQGENVLEGKPDKYQKTDAIDELDYVEQEIDKIYHALLTIKES